MVALACVLGIDPRKCGSKADVLADIFSFVFNTERPIEEVLAEKFPLLRALARANQDVRRLRAKERGD